MQGEQDERPQGHVAPNLPAQHRGLLEGMEGTGEMDRKRAAHSHPPPEVATSGRRKILEGSPSSRAM